MQGTAFGNLGSFCEFAAAPTIVRERLTDVPHEPF